MDCHAFGCHIILLTNSAVCDISFPYWTVIAITATISESEVRKIYKRPKHYEFFHQDPFIGFTEEEQRLFNEYIAYYEQRQKRVRNISYKTSYIPWFITAVLLAITLLRLLP